MLFPSSSTSAESTLLGGFVHRSQASTSPHDPRISLASHSIRSAFGETVQLVADVLQTRGTATLKQITSYLASIAENTRSKVSLSAIRASLLALIQHSICTVDYKRVKGSVCYHYHPEKATYLLRCAQYIEMTRKTVDSTAACVVETLLLAGRLRTTHAVLQASSIAPRSERYTTRESVLQAFCKLVQAGYIQKVAENSQLVVEEEDDDDGEQEWVDREDEAPPKKRQKVSIDSASVRQKTEDASVLALWKANAQYKTTLPLDAVWRVNVERFHETLRAHALGKLVAERYGHKVQSAGIMVTAALRYRSQETHSSVSSETQNGSVFTVDKLLRYLPKTVYQRLEKRPGTVTSNLESSLDALSQFQHPNVIRKVGQHEYEINLPSLKSYMQDRIAHKAVCERFGENAGRIISVLGSLGWLESDKIAEHVMVPAKTARELLHRLYREGYIDMFSATSARMPTWSSSIHLWCADRTRLYRAVTEDTALALWHVRLRRQHEAEIGKEWIVRAEQAADTDENLHEQDRLNYERFCVGLERLDHAALQLDEVLMSLTDY